MIDYKEREVLCSVRNMEVTFGKGRKAFVAVKGVNFDIYKGETFGLVGESGSGKTTIGRAIIRINPISAGEVLFKGERISGKISKEMDKMVTQKIQMIFQDPMASLNERAKVDYIVSEGLMNVHPDMKKEEREERVSQALSDVGLLPEFATRFPHEFSGGQRQRIGIARALIMEPEFIIADEPISALDVSIRAQVLNLMSKLQKERGLTYLFIAHDLSVMRFITDRIAVIHKGVIVELAETEKLYAHPLHPYTQALLSAIPMPDPDNEKKKVVKVYDPSVHHYENDPPRWIEIEEGHFIMANGEEEAKYRAGWQPRHLRSRSGRRKTGGDPESRSRRKRRALRRLLRRLGHRGYPADGERGEPGAAHPLHTGICAGSRHHEPAERLSYGSPERCAAGAGRVLSADSPGLLPGYAGHAVCARDAVLARFVPEALPLLRGRRRSHRRSAGYARKSSLLPRESVLRLDVLA